MSDPKERPRLLDPGTMEYRRAMDDLRLEARRDFFVHGPRQVGLYGINVKAMVEADPFTFTVHKEMDLVEPFAVINNQQSQHLMDSLWECGIRPSEGQGSAGQLAATERHLTDLQKLVFDPPKPKFVVLPPGAEVISEDIQNV